MDKEKKEIAKKTIQDAFSNKEKFFDYEFTQNFQLFLSQLDLLKTLSSLVIALIGIGYFFNDKLDKNFLSLSFIFSLITLLGAVSYTREMIDFESKSIKDNNRKIQDKMDELIDVHLKAITENNFEISTKYIKEELSKNKKIEDRLIYTGEIFTFCFYLSMVFIIDAFLLKEYSFTFNYILLATSIFIAYFLSFKSWASKLISFLSKDIN